MSVMLAIFYVILGIAGGIAVGGGAIALVIVLDIIPRLAQLTRSYHKVHWYEGALISGSVIGTVSDFWNWKLPGIPAFTIVAGLFCGIFVGMLSAALTEILNILPILARRLKMKNYLVGLLMAMVIGKIAGSLFDWLMFLK
ncbi:stage V sporulation protein AB [Paenibacillus sediminis]|uniref:Stage V sporulation protein AB n=1 Tax=Paenibacillus sediminis TaxID=664909 RepID=A0ABS4H0A0_9BACL|nr:stage V sporulation protein AB [Paenibacillus sediminis]MBP1935707.1 stage V sporulation protein AB [Paenibacillus sediminis]